MLAPGEPGCKTARLCHLYFAHLLVGLSNHNKWCFDQDVKVVRGTTFTKRTCNGCGSLQKRGDAVASSRFALH